MEFAWGSDAMGLPASSFPEQGDRWHWPGGGVRLPSGELVIFLMTQRAAPNRDLGFESDGWSAAFVSNPDAAPSDWEVDYVEAPPQAFDAVVGTAVSDDDRLRSGG